MDISGSITAMLHAMRAKRDSLGLSNQDLVDMTGVSLTTVRRVMTDPDTNGLSFETVARLANALNLSIDEYIGVSRETSMQTDVEQLVRAHEAHMTTMRLFIRKQERWLRFSVAMNVLIVAAVMVILFVDILNPTIGWIRRTAASLITWRHNM